MRRILAKTLQRCSLHSGHGLRRAKALRAPRILTYHSIGEAEVSAELFDWQLSFLRKNFELVSLRELLRRRAAVAITGDEVVITFDDGVRNHLSTAYPILLAHQAQATFFVCPALIDSGQWSWNTELRCRLHLLTPDERADLRTDTGCPDAEVESLVWQAKRLNLADRQRAEAWVRDRTRQFSPAPEQIDRYAPMSWEQLASLDPALITIGSHTLNHPILPTLSVSNLREEIVTSRHVLERRLERQVEFFCYPNGDNDSRAQALVRANYAAAVTTMPRAVSGHDDLCLLPRIPAGESAGLFLWRLHRHNA